MKILNEKKLYIGGLLFLQCVSLFSVDKQESLYDIIKNQKYSITKKKNLISDYLKTHQTAINDKDLDGKTPLNCATEYNVDPTIIKFLLDKGADVNQPDLFNETPLHYAVAHEELVTMRMLLQAGALQDFKNDGLQTPLDLARQSPEAFRIIDKFSKAA